VGLLFLESSALVKRYVREVGSAWVRSIVDPAARNQVYIAGITGVEVVSAITRHGRSGYLTPAAMARALANFRSDLAQRYHLIGMTPRLLARAMTLAEYHGLRAYDAVQLAAAVQTNARRRARRRSALILVSADLALNAAATAEGLTVDDPNLHP
jgi:predicted nucleic acid-binding protein